MLYMYALPIKAYTGRLCPCVKRRTFFRLQVYERVGISLVEGFYGCENVEKIFQLFNLFTLYIFKKSAFTAIKGDPKF